MSGPRRQVELFFDRFMFKTVFVILGGGGPGIGSWDITHARSLSQSLWDFRPRVRFLVGYPCGWQIGLLFGGTKQNRTREQIFCGLGGFPAFLSVCVCVSLRRISILQQTFATCDREGWVGSSSGSMFLGVLLL